MHPKPYEVSLRNRIGNHIGEVPSCFYLGFLVFNVLELLLISLFLCRVWGHVFLVGSWRSKFCLSLSFCPIFCLFLPVCGFFIHSHVYTWVFPEQSRMYALLLRTVMYALILSLSWMIKCCWVSSDDWWVFLDASRVCIHPLFLTRDCF